MKKTKLIALCITAAVSCIAVTACASQINTAATTAAAETSAAEEETTAAEEKKSR